MTDDRCDLLCLDLQRAEAVRTALPVTGRTQEMVHTAKALGDPMRLRAAAALAVGHELCVCDLAWVIDAPPNLVSHHLRVLRRAGLVSSRREGKLVMCRLTPRGAALLAMLGPEAWDEDPSPAEGTATILSRGQERSTELRRDAPVPSVMALDG